MALGTPGVGLRGIYGLIVTALGGTPSFHHAALIPQAQELLAAEYPSGASRIVLIIDEAQLLDAESLEGVRCLSNMGMDQTAPFCLLLLGQPTLRHRLRQSAFAALDQRIAVRYAIAGLDARRHQLRAHHLALAGRSDTLFSDDALDADPRDLPRPPAPGQQPRGRLADRRVRAKKAIVDELGSCRGRRGLRRR